jgi:hypothetical protein
MNYGNSQRQTKINVKIKYMSGDFRVTNDERQGIQGDLQVKGSLPFNRFSEI